MHNVARVIETKGRIDEPTLTRSLRELLEEHVGLGDVFVRWTAGKRWTIEGKIHVQSIKDDKRVSDDQGFCRPDMEIVFRDGTGKIRVIRNEHKWLGNFADPNQLARYGALTDVPRDDVCLVFIAPYSDDVAIGAYHCNRAATWREIAELLRGASPVDDVVRAWADTIIERAPGSSRRGLDLGVLQHSWDAVQQMHSDHRIRRRVPEPLRAGCRLIPPDWDRTALYWGLSASPFSVANCRCVYFGFRYHQFDLNVPLQGDRALDLILAVHSPKIEQAADMAGIEAAASRLRSLPLGLRPTVVHPPDDIRGRWHKLVAIAPLPIAFAGSPNPGQLAACALEVFPAWWETVEHLATAHLG